MMTMHIEGGVGHMPTESSNFRTEMIGAAGEGHDILIAVEGAEAGDVHVTRLDLNDTLAEGRSVHLPYDTLSSGGNEWTVPMLNPGSLEYVVDRDFFGPHRLTMNETPSMEGLLSRLKRHDVLDLATFDSLLVLASDARLVKLLLHDVWLVAGNRANVRPRSTRVTPEMLWISLARFIAARQDGEAALRPFADLRVAKSLYLLLWEVTVLTGLGHDASSVVALTRRAPLEASFDLIVQEMAYRLFLDRVNPQMERVYNSYSSLTSGSVDVDLSHPAYLLRGLVEVTRRALLQSSEAAEAMARSLLWSIRTAFLLPDEGAPPLLPALREAILPWTQNLTLVRMAFREYGGPSEGEAPSQADVLLTVQMAVQHLSGALSGNTRLGTMTARELASFVHVRPHFDPNTRHTLFSSIWADSETNEDATRVCQSIAHEWILRDRGRASPESTKPALGEEGQVVGRVHMAMYDPLPLTSSWLEARRNRNRIFSVEFLQAEVEDSMMQSFLRDRGRLADANWRPYVFCALPSALLLEACALGVAQDAQILVRADSQLVGMLYRLPGDLPLPVQWDATNDGAVWFTDPAAVVAVSGRASTGKPLVWEPINLSQRSGCTGSDRRQTVIPMVLCRGWSTLWISRPQVVPAATDR